MKEQLLYIQSLQHRHDDFKRTQVLTLEPEESEKLQAIFREVFHRNMRTHCSNCFVEDFFSILIASRQRLDEIEAEEKQQAIEQDITSALNSIELAQLADDEQKPKRKRK